jgi:hypothetical protein
MTLPWTSSWDYRRRICMNGGVIGIALMLVGVSILSREGQPQLLRAGFASLRHFLILLSGVLQTW